MKYTMCAKNEFFSNKMDGFTDILVKPSICQNFWVWSDRYMIW